MSSQFEKRIIIERENQKIIDYFNEICLGSELGWSPPVTVKAKGTTWLFISHLGRSEEQIKFAKSVTVLFNKLATDGCNIQLTNDSSKATSHLYLYPLAKIKSHPSFKSVDSNYFGLFKTFPKNNIITKADIFINTDKPLEKQKAAILEEIIQSMGFFKDSELYPNSIFFQFKYNTPSAILVLSELDEKIIRLLYSSKMKVGLNRNETTDVIREILK